VESTGPLGHEASEFLTDLGRRLSVITDDAHDRLLLTFSSAFQFSFSARGSFVEEVDDVSDYLQTLFFNPRDLYYRG